MSSGHPRTPRGQRPARNRVRPAADAARSARRSSLHCGDESIRIPRRSRSAHAGATRSRARRRVGSARVARERRANCRAAPRRPSSASRARPSGNRSNNCARMACRSAPKRVAAIGSMRRSSCSIARASNRRFRRACARVSARSTCSGRSTRPAASSRAAPSTSTSLVRVPCRNPDPRPRPARTRVADAARRRHRAVVLARLRRRHGRARGFESRRRHRRAARASRTRGVAGAALKWPNDIVADGRKLGGILVELGGDALGPCHAIVGIGINRAHAARVRWRAIDQPWTDLAALTGGRVPSRNVLAGRMLARLAEALDTFAAQGFAAFERDYAATRCAARPRDPGLERRRAVRSRIADGVTSRGALRIVRDGVEREVDSGEVSVRRVESSRVEHDTARRPTQRAEGDQRTMRMPSHRFASQKRSRKPMQLLIDLGNTRLKWALARSGAISRARRVRACGRRHHRRARTRVGDRCRRCGTIYVASVASLGLDVDIETFVRQRFGAECEFLRSPATALGIRNAYPEPQRLGIDRFLALAAAARAPPRARKCSSASAPR